MSTRGKYSEQQKISTIKYVSANLDRIEIKVPKGIKSELSNLAESNGTNLTALIKDAIKKYTQELGYNIPLSMTEINNKKKFNYKKD